MPPIIDKEKCIGCGTCVQICPCEVFDVDHQPGTVPVALYPQECWHCNACVLDCPAGAVSLSVPLPYMLLHVDASTLKPGERPHV